jgi:predicted chitinase
MCAFNVGTESAGQVAEYLEKNLHNSNNLFLGSRNLFSSFNSLEKCFGQKISSKKEVKKNQRKNGKAKNNQPLEHGPRHCRDSPAHSANQIQSGTAENGNE